MAVKGRKSRYSDLTMVRAVGVPELAAFNCRHNIIVDVMIFMLFIK